MFSREELLQVRESIETEITNSKSLKKDAFIFNDKYKILKTIYCGDNGFVYKALNIFTKEEVVIKEFFPQQIIEIDNEVLELRRSSNVANVELVNYTNKRFDLFLNLVSKFLKEAEYLKNLSSNNHIVTINESFQSNNTAYIVLDYIEYPTLKELLSSDLVIRPKQMIEIYNSLLDSVEYIHDKNIIHRDIKPNNLFVTPEGVIIGDFGISKFMSEIKMSNTVVYTESFSSPEQISGKGKQGTWTDIYSLGKLLEYIIISIGRKNNLKSDDEAFISGLNKISEEVDTKLLTITLEKACLTDIELRLKDVRDLRKSLVVNVKPVKKKRKLIYYFAAVACILLVFAVYINRESYSDDIPEIVDAFYDPVEEEAVVSEPVEVEAIVSEPVEVEVVTDSVEEEVVVTDSVEEEAIVSDTVEVEVVVSDVVEEVVLDPVEEIIEFSALEFITLPGAGFDYNSDQIIEWTNSEDHKGFFVSVTNLNTWLIHYNYMFYLEGSNIDLSSYGLNPGKYRIYIFAQPKEESFEHYLKWIDINITGGNTEILKPTFNSEFYSFNESDEIVIDLVGSNDTTEYKITDIKNSKVIAKNKTGGDKLKLNGLNLEEGMYSVIVNNVLNGSKSNCSITTISVVKDENLKRIVFKTPMNAVFDYYSDKLLMWEPLEKSDSISLKIEHLYSGKIRNIDIEGGKSSVNLDYLLLDAGSYNLSINYVKDGIKSSSTINNVVVSFPYLPAPVITNTLEASYNISDLKSVEWQEQARAERYYVNIINSDTKEVIELLETDELFLEITKNITTVGNFTVEIFYKDSRNNDSVKSVLNFTVND